MTPVDDSGPAQGSFTMKNFAELEPVTMTKRDDGGPAFPGGEIGHESWTEHCIGMSLPDWFAGQALPFCLAEFGGNADDGRQPAEAAYQIADAMIAARKAKP